MKLADSTGEICDVNKKSFLLKKLFIDRVHIINVMEQVSVSQVNVFPP